MLQGAFLPTCFATENFYFEFPQAAAVPSFSSTCDSEQPALFYSYHTVVIAASMGYRKNQEHGEGTDGLPSSTSGEALPPPPRSDTIHLYPYYSQPPSYETAISGRNSRPLHRSWTGQDPRASSTESLAPRTPDSRDGRRTLLLIYIHGFLGTETSFQSFPVHVHNLLVTKLADTHFVHSKIYPRYKSRKVIEVARDDFSNW